MDCTFVHHACTVPTENKNLVRDSFNNNFTSIHVNVDFIELCV